MIRRGLWTIHFSASPAERRALNAVAWAHSREAAGPTPRRRLLARRWARALLALVDRYGGYLAVVDDKGEVVAVLTN
ncbi:MAG TPA: hypothetical protein VII06_13320 [Chloroflexota bacterium]|jgi:hypothetical protein